MLQLNGHFNYPVPVYPHTLSEQGNKFTWLAYWQKSEDSSANGRSGAVQSSQNKLFDPRGSRGQTVGRQGRRKIKGQTDKNRSDTGGHQTKDRELVQEGRGGFKKVINESQKKQIRQQWKDGRNKQGMQN